MSKNGFKHNYKRTECIVLILELKIYVRLLGDWKNCEWRQALSGDFERMWQNAHVNTVRRAMVCDVYSPFPKVL